MVLRSFWSSFGLLFGALGGLLGDLWGLHIDQKGVTRIHPCRFGALDFFCWLCFVIFDSVLSFFLSCRSFLGPFFIILRTSQLKTSLLIRIRRTSQLKTSFWRSENPCFYCFWWMSQLKSLFFKMRGMSHWIASLLSGDITVWILTFLLILDVFPS